jgi:hypothetical protein
MLDREVATAARAHRLGKLASFRFLHPRTQH